MAKPSNAQDWANLQRYSTANKLLGPPAKGEERVVFIGNSITEGWMYVSPGLFDNPKYINRGIGGQTTGQMKIRFWQDVIELQPKMVIILAGINDIAQNQGYVPLEQTAQNIFDMAELACSQNIKVVLCSVLPANIFPWRLHIKPAEKIIALNTLLKNYARENNFVYVDFYSEMVNSEKGLKVEYTYDGVHCLEAGYRKMETLVMKILK